MATRTSASIIVGFGYDDPYEFLFAMTHCPFDPADIHRMKRLSILHVLVDCWLRQTLFVTILITFV